MTEETLLDRAHAAMAAAPEDDGARMQFYETLAGSELFLLLAEEAQEDTVTPRTVTVEEETYVLAFDREARLAQFADGAAPYAGMSGRAVAGLLADEGLGLALNPDVAPSAILLPPSAMAWLAQTLANAPDEIEARAQAFHAPGGLPERLLTALDQRLASAAGLAEMAYLVGVTYDTGARGHMLGVIGAAPGAERALAQAVSEALTFSGLEAGALDVGFFAASDPVAARLAKAGLRFDLPKPEAPRPADAGPGTDPARPPKLR